MPSNVRVCTPRDRSKICPAGTVQNGFTNLGDTRLPFDPLQYLNIEYVTTPHPNPGAFEPCNSRIQATLYPWWHPGLDAQTLINVTGNGQVVSIPADDLANHRINVLREVHIHLRFEQNIEQHIHSTDGTIDYGGSDTNVSQVALNGDILLFGTDTSDNGVIIDGKNFDLSAALTAGECWKVDTDPTFLVQVHGDQRLSQFIRNTNPFISACDGRYLTTILTNTHLAVLDGYYIFETWEFNCKVTTPPKCPPCTPKCSGPFNAGTTGVVCATGTTGVGRGLGTWHVKDKDSNVVGSDMKGNGWRVDYNYDCTISVHIPCIQAKTQTLLRFSVDFQDTIGTTVGGCFDVTPQLAPCPQTGHNFSCVEMDSPRMWLHAGAGANVITYSQPDNVSQFEGSAGTVDKWLRLRADGRQAGALAMLGQVEKTDTAGKVTRTFSVWISRDGGASGDKAVEMAGQSSLIERDSERGYLLWFYTDGTNQVTLRQSKDWLTWDPAQPVMLDGKRMQATLLDSCQDPRNNGRIAMVVAVGKDPLAPVAASVIVFSDDAGESFTTGLT